MVDLLGAEGENGSITNCIYFEMNGRGGVGGGARIDSALPRRSPLEEITQKWKRRVDAPILLRPTQRLSSYDWTGFTREPAVFVCAHLSHEGRRVLERRVAKPRALTLDDGGRQHGHDVGWEAGDVSGHPEQHSRGALVISPTDHLFNLKKKRKQDYKITRIQDYKL